MVSQFEKWSTWFSENENKQGTVPWSPKQELSAQERKAIAKSIAMFQRGESSDGKSAMAVAETFLQHETDKSYYYALKAFFKEENRHADYLGKFMDIQDIPKEKSHWIDYFFRKLRHAGGLENLIRVILTAEIIAMTYYKTLISATENKCLKAICNQILKDEFHHLNFQSECLSKLSKGRSKWKNTAWAACSLIMLEVAMGIVWFSHRRVFRKARMGFFTFLNETRVWRKFCFTKIRNSSEGTIIREKDTTEKKILTQAS